MTLEEMRAIGAQAEHIARLKDELAKKRHSLMLINRRQASLRDKHWEVELVLARGGDNGRGISISVRLPFGFVQQQAIDAITHAKRELTMAGGEE